MRIQRNSGDDEAIEVVDLLGRLYKVSSASKEVFRLATSHDLMFDEFDMGNYWNEPLFSLKVDGNSFIVLYQGLRGYPQEYSRAWGNTFEELHK
ncbi:hypothetical protein QJS10_CPB20g01868 [Acorus calamus]|uniref:Uncharacterized protein n=1 Tax=Acorus calamus TaxID=4465 RepID=A0AAV9CC94_ACOCL|nr:hypothetical protein QJS10_CPB20g01868 [Acorus calamus]